MTAIRSAYLAFTLSCLATATSAETRFGDWTVQERSGEDGRVCSAGVSSSDGKTRMSIEAGEGAYALVFENADYGRGAPPDAVTFHVDSLRFTLPVPYSQGAFRAGDASGALRAQMAAGHGVVLVGDDIARHSVTEFSLSGSAGALKAIRSCAGY